MTDNKYKRVLIAVDCDPTSEKIAEAGLDLAKRLHAEIAILTVVDTSLLLGSEGLTAHEARSIAKTAAAENLNALVANIFGHHNISRYIMEGSAEAQILKVAKEWPADILVVGTHGRKGLARMILGSVAERVIKNSNIPVIVIPVNHG